MFRRTYNAQAKAKEELGVFGYSLQPHSTNWGKWTADKDFVDENGQTHLHQGVDKYCLQDTLFENALSVGCDVNALDSTGSTALHIACRKGLIHCVDKLLKHGAKTDIVNTEQMTSLMYACRHGNQAMAKSLIKHGANVNQSNARGELALHYSCTHAHQACTELLLKHKSKPNYPDNEGNTPLIIVSKMGNVAVVEAVLAAGGRPDKTDNIGRTPLHWAALAGKKDIIETLIKAGASVDVTDKQFVTAFMYSIISDSADVLKVLVGAECDRTCIDGLNGTALSLAALKGQCACVKVLLEGGEDPDEFSFFGMTALMAAVYESHIDVTKTILKYGANVNIVSRLGFTALFAALCDLNGTNAAKRHHILVLLLQYGADINLHISGVNLFTMVHSGKNYPMAFAATSGYASLVNILVQAGCDITADELRDMLSQDTASQLYDITAITQPIMDHKRKPLALRSISRLLIRKQLGDKPHTKLQKLPIPNELREYLNFSDLYSVYPDRATKCGTSDAVVNMLGIRACGLQALEGTFLFQKTEEPVLRAAPPGPCQCNTCCRIAAAQNS